MGGGSQQQMRATTLLKPSNGQDVSEVAWPMVLSGKVASFLKIGVGHNGQTWARCSNEGGRC